AAALRIALGRRGTAPCGVNLRRPSFTARLRPACRRSAYRRQFRRRPPDGPAGGLASRTAGRPAGRDGVGVRPGSPRRAWTRTRGGGGADRKSTRLNSSHLVISYAVFCLKKKKETT